jgi:hypothetical protein
VQVVEAQDARSPACRFVKRADHRLNERDDVGVDLPIGGGRPHDIDAEACCNAVCERCVAAGDLPAVEDAGVADIAPRDAVLTPERKCAGQVHEPSARIAGGGQEGVSAAPAPR